MLALQVQVQVSCKLSSWRLAKWPSQAKEHAHMRLTCGSHVVGCVLAHLKLLLAARGPPKPSFEPRRGRRGMGHRLPKFANFVKC